MSEPIKTHLPFDTLAYSKKLQQAGMDANLAEELTNMNAEMISHITKEQLATKKDFREFRSESTKELESVRQEIKELRHETKQEIYDLEKRLYTFIAKAIGWSIAILSAIQGLFHFIK